MKSGSAGAHGQYRVAPEFAYGETVLRRQRLLPLCEARSIAMATREKFLVT